MDDVLNSFMEVLKKLSIPIGLALLGTIVHIQRTKEKLSLIQFAMHTVINVAVVYGTGVICTDYFKVDNERLVWVLSGVACSFSTYILNFFQTLITDIAPDAARKLFNVDKKEDE